MLKVDFVCRCGNNGGTLKVGETTSPCRQCGRVYRAITFKKQGAIAVEVDRIVQKQLPLISCNLNKQLYKERGKEGSCEVSVTGMKLLPRELQEQLKYHINSAIDILRDNLDIDKMIEGE